MSIFVAKSFTKTLTNFLINGIIYMSIIFWRILMKEKFKSWVFSREHGKCDVITLIIYLLGVCTVSFFHEPWFDEAQAWAIARSGTIKEILFEIPHYEGHPPLWHLILTPFAKLGAPYELSLAAVNIFFMTLAVTVLLFKSPFPKLIRCLLPFNFFLFYQYGVISRPYCILVLAIFLAAVCYKNRNEHPVKYLLCLTLMCAIHSMGIIIAGAFCIVWLCEIFAEKYRAGKLATVFKDKRCWLMASLLILVLLIIVEIFPHYNTYTPSSSNTDELFSFNFSISTLLRFMLIITEATVGQMPPGPQYIYDYISLIPLCALSFFLFALCCMLFCKNKKLSIFLLTYTLFASFCVLLYSSVHHMGLVMILLIYLFWIILDENGRIELPKFFVSLYNSVGNALKIAIKIIAFLPLIVPITWTGASSYLDIRYPYWLNEAADFIKEYDLEDYRILSPWTQELVEDPEDVWGVDEATLDWEDYPLINGIAVALDPYFDYNVFYNFNIDDPEQTFQWHKSTTEEENEEIFAKWREQGPPDVVLDRCQITKVYPDIDVNDYVAVKRIEVYKPYKFKTDKQYITIYVTKDLFNKIGTLEELTAKKLY